MAMEFPVRLYHKDNGSPEFAADARHSQYTTYPILVTCQEDLDRLGPGWRTDPLAAAAWKPGDAEPERRPSSTETSVEELLASNMVDVLEQIEAITSVVVLTMMADAEAEGKNRKGVQSAIAERIEELS